MQGARQRLTTAEQHPQTRAIDRGGLGDEHRQLRRNEVCGGYFLSSHQLRQVGRITVALRCGDHQRRTGHQRPPQLPDRRVEPERRLVEHSVRRLQPEHPLCPEEVVDQAAVSDHHALRPPRRSGRVHHIRRAPGRQDRTRPGRGRRCIPPSRLRLVDGKHGDGQVCRKFTHVRARREHAGRTGVGQREREPFRGMVRIDGEIGSTRLPHRQQSHYQLDRPLQHDRRHRLRPQPPIGQQLRQQVRPLVQLPIRHTFISIHDRDSARVPQHLVLEQRQPGRLRLWYDGVVPAGHHLVPFRLRQHLDLPHPNLRVRGHQRQDLHQPLSDRIHGPGIEQIRRPGNRPPQPHRATLTISHLTQ